MREQIKAALEGLTPRQRQWLTVGGLAGGVFAVFYLIFAVTDQGGSGDSTKPAGTPGTGKTSVTNVMSAGQQVDPRDKWVGLAGKKLAEQDADRVQQQQFNQQVLSRFETLEKQLTQKTEGKPMPPAQTPVSPVAESESFPPSSALAGNANLPAPPPAPKVNSATRMPAGTPDSINAGMEALQSTLSRISLGGASHTGETAATSKESAAGTNEAKSRSANDYLPVSFFKADIIGGLDAPTGGQAQSNPQPVLLRVADDAVLPNRYRSQVKECFVIAAGYGDISSERAYMRTESLSCVRHDKTTLEVKLTGSVFGEDGKLGVRGRLVEKQGQLLARALMAGIASGIGQAFGTGASTISVSPLGSTQTLETGKAFEYGVSTGVGKALDRLAQYYIKMAETIFPVIEVDAGRRVDIVVTKGVVIDAPVNGPSNRSDQLSPSNYRSVSERLMAAPNDEDD